MSITSRLMQLEKVIKEPDIWDGLMVIPYTVKDAKLLHRLYHQTQTPNTMEGFNDLCERYKNVPKITLEEWEIQILSELNGKKKIDWSVVFENEQITH